MRILAIVGPITAALLLSGCGTSTTDRALSGGAIGAGTGAAVGAVTDMDMSTGALLGAGIGALGGVMTGPRNNRNQDDD